MSTKAKPDPKQQVEQLKAEIAGHEKEIEQYVSNFIPHAEQVHAVAKAELQRVEEIESGLVLEAVAKANPEAQSNLDDLKPVWEKATRSERHCATAIKQTQEKLVVLRRDLVKATERLRQAEKAILVDEKLELSRKAEGLLQKELAPLLDQLQAKDREIAQRTDSSTFLQHADRALAHGVVNVCPALLRVIHAYTPRNGHTMKGSLVELGSNLAGTVEIRLLA